MNEAAASVKSASRAGKIWGFIVIILGFLAIGTPFVAGVAVTLTVGIILLATGVSQFIYAFGSSSFGGGVLRFLFGLLAVLAGLALVSQPGAGLVTITLFLAAWFLVDGIWALVAGFQFRPSAGWGWMVFSGVVSILLGVMIYNQFPESAVWLVGVLVGIRLIFSGWTMVVLGAAGSALADAVSQPMEDSGDTGTGPGAI